MSDRCAVCHRPLPEGELHRLGSMWGAMCRSLLRCGPPPGQHWRDRQSRPDMVVRSIEGDRWGELGRMLTPTEREAAVDALIAKLDRAERRLREMEDE